MKPAIPHGRMTVSKARQRWEAVRQSAQEGDPDKMLDAVQKFQSIADLMLNQWSEE